MPIQDGWKAGHAPAARLFGADSPGEQEGAGGLVRGIRAGLAKARVSRETRRELNYLHPASGAAAFNKTTMTG